MEKRMVLAIVLSMALIFIFSWRNSQRLRETQRRRAAQPVAEYAQSVPSSATTTPTIAEAPTDIRPATQDAAQPPPVDSHPWSLLTQTAQQTAPATCVVTGDLWHVVLTNQGAVPISWRLLKYREVFPDPRYLALRASKPAPPAVSARLDDDRYLEAFLPLADLYLDRQELEIYREMEPFLRKNPDLNEDNRLFCADELVPGHLMYPASPMLCRWGHDTWDTSVTYSGPQGVLRVDDRPVDVVYTAEQGDLRVSKIYRFTPGEYRVDFSIRIENIGKAPLQWGKENQYGLTWQGGIARPSTQPQRLNSAHVAGTDGDMESYPQMPRKTLHYASIAKTAIKKGNTPIPIDGFETLWMNHVPKNGVRWVGIDTKYFLGAIRPHMPVKVALVGLSRIPGDSVDYIRPAMGMEITLQDLNPGQIREDVFDLYVGPKEGPRLTAVDETLEDLIENYWLSSIVSPIAKLLLRLLQFFYRIVPNYGVGIILLTFLVRLLMYPLYHKQMASMKKMQQLQPQVAALRERYKDNPQELQRKTMEFYREHKVNPMAGCLTMLPTIPIFIALWGTFNQAIELRGAPFVWWIQDLSQPDQAFFLPLAGYIIPVNILPIMYCILMLWSQARQKIEAPNAAMMKVLPVVFTFLFWSIASGVILYFVVSMTVDTCQRIIIDKFGEKETATRVSEVPALERVRASGGRSQSRRKQR